MDIQESRTDIKSITNRYYTQEVRLEEGIQVEDLVSGKGTTFTVKEDEEILAPNAKKVWTSNTMNSIGIDPEVHEGGSFKSIEKDFTERVTKDGHVLKKLVQPGMGKIIPPRAWVKINYCYYAEGNDEPVDSTWLRSKPTNFILTDGEVLPGLDVAVATMKKGEKAHFLVGHQYAYGPMGVPPRIPKKARLLFEVEVLHFLDENMINEYDKLSPDDKRDIPQDKILIIASTLREKGNEAHKVRSYNMAHNSYLKAVRVLEGCSPADEEEETYLQAEQIKSLLNLASTCIELGKTNDSRRYADDAIRFLMNDNIRNGSLLNYKFKLSKAYYIKYKSFSKEQKLEQAKNCLTDAAKYTPEDEIIRKAFKRLEQEQAREDAIEKKSMSDMAEGMGWKG